MASGGCNWWDNAPQSVCGTFETPEVEDLGQCASYRVKITCDAPTLPVAQCLDDAYEVIYQPDNIDNPFAILGTLFNECCAAITDQNGNPIMLLVNQMGGYPDGVCPP